MSRKSGGLDQGVLIPGSSEFDRLMHVLKFGEAVPEDLVREIGAKLGVSDLRIRKLYTTWNELTLDLALLFLETRSAAYVASRYFDFRISEAGLRAVKNGCRFKVLHSGRAGSPTRAQVLGNLATSPKASRVFSKVVNNPLMSVKEAELPYSFVVLDSRTILTEIIDPKDPDYFSVGLRMESKELASRLIALFNELMKTGIDDTRKPLYSSHLRSAAPGSSGDALPNDPAKPTE